jgi:hypothetical protein
VKSTTGTHPERLGHLLQTGDWNWSCAHQTSGMRRITVANLRLTPFQSPARPPLPTGACSVSGAGCQCAGRQPTGGYSKTIARFRGTIAHGSQSASSGPACVGSIKSEDRHRPKQAYPIPCPTLCSKAIAGGKGLAVHMIGQQGTRRTFDTLIWQMSASSGFREEGVSLAYRLGVEDGKIVRV